MLREDQLVLDLVWVATPVPILVLGHVEARLGTDQVDNLLLAKYLHVVQKLLVLAALGVFLLALGSWLDPLALPA